MTLLKQQVTQAVRIYFVTSVTLFCSLWPNHSQLFFLAFSLFSSLSCRWALRVIVMAVVLGLHVPLCLLWLQTSCEQHTRQELGTSSTIWTTMQCQVFSSMLELGDLLLRSDWSVSLGQHTSLSMCELYLMNSVVLATLYMCVYLCLVFDLRKPL